MFTPRETSPQVDGSREGRTHDTASLRIASQPHDQLSYPAASGPVWGQFSNIWTQITQSKLTTSQATKQSLELLKKKKKKKKKKRTFLRGSGDMLPQKILKVETKICVIWGILKANLKKSSELKFIMNISFVPSVCIHSSIILIFIGKKRMLVDYFSQWKFFSAIFDFHFHENPQFHDEFQALIKLKKWVSLHSRHVPHATNTKPGMKEALWVACYWPKMQRQANHILRHTDKASEMASISTVS